MPEPHSQAGTSWSNPIWYRGYKIHYGSTVFAAWVFAHDSYDGAPDAGDNRCGYADTVQECREQINEIEDSVDERGGFDLCDDCGGDGCTACDHSGFQWHEDETPDADCTCTMSHTHSASIDPPHEIVDPWCPIHGGRDADREYDEMRDRQMEGDGL